jgi:enolase
MDATTDKSNLGGNLILVLSLLFARGYSGIMEVDLSDYIRQIFEGNSINQFPRPIFNVINGGAHVKIPLEWKKKFGVSFPLDFQEFWVVPSVNDFALALSVGREFYHKLGRELEKIYGKEGLILGDEAGYTCPFKTNEEAFEIIQELINRHLYPLKMGLDAAASGFFNKNNQSYLIEGKEMTPEELTMLYYNLAHTYEIGFIEDPFHQEAFSDFARLYKEMPQLVVITDDLTTTNPQRLLEAILKKSANAILIKPNQIGTLSETLKVIALAYKNNWQVIVSHRSGETQDDFIADLAVGVGAFGLKAGSPETKFRMAKYLRALELWQKRN